MNVVIGHITVKDAAKWAEYRSQVPATLAPWDAELVFRGEKLAVLGGTHRHSARPPTAGSTRRPIRH